MNTHLTGRKYHGNHLHMGAEYRISSKLGAVIVTFSRSCGGRIKLPFYSLINLIIYAELGGVTVLDHNLQNPPAPMGGVPKYLRDDRVGWIFHSKRTNLNRINHASLTSKFMSGHFSSALLLLFTKMPSDNSRNLEDLSNRTMWASVTMHRFYVAVWCSSAVDIMGWKCRDVSAVPQFRMKSRSTGGPIDILMPCSWFPCPALKNISIFHLIKCCT